MSNDSSPRPAADPTARHAASSSAREVKSREPIAISYDALEVEVSFLAAPRERSGEDLEVDLVAFLLDRRRLLPKAEFLVFYNNPTSFDGAVTLHEDLPGGGDSIHQRHAMRVQLDRLDPCVEEVVFAMSIHNAVDNKLHWGLVQDFSLVVRAEGGHDLVVHRPGVGGTGDHGAEVGRLLRSEQGWIFEAGGPGTRGGLEALILGYYEAT